MGWEQRGLDWMGWYARQLGWIGWDRIRRDEGDQTIFSIDGTLTMVISVRYLILGWCGSRVESTGWDRMGWDGIK